MGRQILLHIGKNLETALILVIAAGGMLLVLYNTRLGAYWSDDTYYYILPAQQVMLGEGFHPSSIFGPVLPAVLALLSLFKFDPLVSLRWLNAFLFAVNILLTALIVHKATRRHWFALAASLLVLTAEALVEIHGWAMSEGLAITFSLLAVEQALVYFNNHKFMPILAAALFSSLAVLTRFASMPLIPAIALTILLLDPAKKFLVRAGNAVLLGLVSLAPFFLYLWRNTIISGSPLRYEHFMTVPLERSQVVWFLYNWFALFLPGRFLRGHEMLFGLMSLIVLVLGSLLLAWVAKKKGYQPAKPVTVSVVLCSTLILFTIAMLIIARGFTELTVFNPRYLIPPYLFTLILLVIIASQIWQIGNRYIRMGLILVFVGYFTYYSYRTIDFTIKTSSTGLGYSNIGWHQSETVQYIIQHPEITDMVSTGEMGIYFWTGRMPTVLAAFSNPVDLEIFLCERDAPLFIMDQMPTDMYGMSREDTVKDLTLDHQFNDSSMYVCSTIH